MTPTPANDNTPRPIWFDDLLAQYDGFIRAKCSAYDDHEDLYQDAILRVLDRWHQYRRDGNFVAWVGYHIKSVRPEQARRAKRGEKYPHYIATDTREPTQDYYVDITKALRSVDSKEAEAMVLSSAGYTCREMAKVMRLSRQTTLDLAARGRDRLRAANDNNKVGNAAA